ncbi:MAG: 6,7-dimethyl-8-ribityllumazine synthase [Opitutales bacterium]
MSLDTPDGGRLTSEGLRLGVVCARYNGELTDALLTRVTTLIEDAGPPERLVVERVPGSHEVPVAMTLMLESDSFDCLVGLGVVIKGATSHHHLVAENAGSAMQQLAMERAIPIINGIIVTDDPNEARERVTGPIDRGREFAEAALHMATLKRKWKKNSN